MKSSSILVLLLCLCIFSTGCLYSNFKAPLDTDLDETRLGQKQGEASTHSVLWLVAWGDSGTAAAAKNGNLTQINHMDIGIFNILYGLYVCETTIVYGD